MVTKLDLFTHTVGIQLPDKFGIGMVDFRKNWASDNWSEA
jgi:hypothetical protein